MTVHDPPVSQTGTGKENRLEQRTDWRSRLEWIAPALMAVAAVGSYIYLSSRPEGSDLLSPPLVAAILLINLVPAIMLLMLAGRRIALRRASLTAIGGNGRLHVRLVELFSLVTAIPMLLVVVFASLLFQYGVEFWFSDRARGMIENANDLARGYYEQNRREVGEETVTMATDLRTYLGEARLDSPEFAEGYVFQVLSRKLNESAIIEIGADGVARTAALVDPDQSGPEERIAPNIIKRLDAGEDFVVIAKPDRIEAVTALDRDGRIYLYAARDSDMLSLSQWERAQAVLRDYDQMFERTRNLQLQFNIALFFGTLVIIAVTLWVALVIADRLVRPVGDLVHAAQRVSEGDMATRVTVAQDQDEIATLGNAFNRMTERLERQTGALLNANEQLSSRRDFIETVLESVSAGVISLDKSGQISLINSQAQHLLDLDDADATGKALADYSTELAGLLDKGDGQEIIQISREREIRTLAVKVAAGSEGHVLTFEDITQQLLDQRRAAWSDVARRIAHEIKNPLTPIQLAAERLKRRFGGNIEEGRDIFEGLTETIVRQVGDLRNIVDEFSAFARMPKPSFHEEDLTDIVRQAMLMQDVAHHDIVFEYSGPEGPAKLMCDRRQIAQALTNILKNAGEAIERKMEIEADDSDYRGKVETELNVSGDLVLLSVKDNGIGLPKERERIVEPYMTTREQGTGLGLAIVKKIVEEHFGEISFADNAGGGTIVTLSFSGTIGKEKTGRAPAEEGA